MGAGWDRSLRQCQIESVIRAIRAAGLPLTLIVANDRWKVRFGSPSYLLASAQFDHHDLDRLAEWLVVTAELIAPQSTTDAKS